MNDREKTDHQHLIAVAKQTTAESWELVESARQAVERAKTLIKRHAARIQPVNIRSSE